jgi:DNA repair exonuclease SbcCD nuclease subunit
MSEIVIFGDCHIGDYPNARQVESEIDSAFSQIQDYVQENNISLAFSVGDIVRKKKGIPQLSVSILAKINKHLTGAYAISGNHDQDEDNFFNVFYPYRSTSKSVVAELSNIYSLDNHNVCNNNTTIWGLPFYRNGSDFFEALSMFQPKKDSDWKNILLIHQTPNTTAFSENCSDTIDINHKLFKHFDLIICGHIHEHKQLSDKFWQIGSLVPLNRSENTQKFFLSVDTKTLEVKAIPIKQNITFSEKTKIENNSKLSKKVVEKAKEFDLLEAAAKYAEQNEFTDFQKNHSQNTILQAKKI